MGLEGMLGAIVECIWTQLSGGFLSFIAELLGQVYPGVQ